MQNSKVSFKKQIHIVISDGMPRLFLDGNIDGVKGWGAKKANLRDDVTDWAGIAMKHVSV